MANRSLEKLIKSLSRGELKAFSSSIKNSSSTEYYKLFQQIKLGKGKSANDSKSNAQQRKYLYDSLLNSLNNSTNSIGSDILKKLLNTETLFKRQLIKEAWKEINKALKLAQKHERFGFIIQILEWKKTIGFYMDDFTLQNHIELSQMEEKVLNQQMYYLNTKNLYLEILNLKKEVGYLELNYDKSKFKKFDINIDPEVKSQRTIFYSLITRSIYHWMLKEHQQEYLLTKELTDIIDINFDSTEYLIGFLEHSTSCVCNASFPELLTTLSSLKTKYSQGYFGNNPSIELKLFYYSANYEIMSYAYIGDKEMLTKKILEVEKAIDYWQKSLSKEMLIIIYSALKTGYYFVGNSKKSKHYVNKLLTESSKALRKDAYEEALLFNLIITFDKSDFDFQERELIKTIRYLKSNNMQESFEYKFSTLLRKNILDDNIFEKVFNDLKDEFDKYYYRLADNRLYSENYLPIYIWLLSKINNEPFINTMKKWNNNTL